MTCYSDIDPMDIDPQTGRPYSNYSSPSLDTSFHDNEMAGDDEDDDLTLDPDSDEYCPGTDDHMHVWPRVEEHERCLCVCCGADGDA